MTIRRRHMLVWIVLCGLAGLFSPRIEAQSFDCEKASTIIEKTICNDQAVSDFDQQLGGAIKKRLNQHPEWRGKLLLSQRRWLQYRDAQCIGLVGNLGKADDCLRAAYAARLSVIESPNPLARPIPHVTATGLPKAVNAPYTPRADLMGPPPLKLRYPPNFHTVLTKTLNAGLPMALYVQNSVPRGETAGKWSSMIEFISELGASADSGGSLSASAWNKYRYDYRQPCQGDSDVAQLGSPHFAGYPGFVLVASCGSTTADRHGETALIAAIQGPSDSYLIEWIQRGPHSDHYVPIDTALWCNRLRQLDPTAAAQTKSGSTAACGTELIECTVYCGQEPSTRLSPSDVRSLANDAAKKASLDMTHFRPAQPRFDPATKVWWVDYTAQPTKGYTPDAFSVFVYDATSHTEATCLGRYAYGVPIDTEKLPDEIQPFLTTGGGKATELACADLNDDGRPDYLLVTQQPTVRLPGQGLYAGKRVFQILLRQPNGTLVSAVRNESAIDASSSDYKVIVRRGKFEIVNESMGSGGGDAMTAYFSYSDDAHEWLLTRADKEVIGSGGANEDHGYSQRPTDFGRVTISDFNIRNFQ